jgi:hypothetical protein
MSVPTLALRPEMRVAASPSSAQSSTTSAIAELKRRGLYTSLQQAMQAALYRVEPQRSRAGGYTADNPAQRYSVQFGSAGTDVQLGAGQHVSRRLSMRLSGVDAGGDKIGLSSVHLRASGSRMEYDRGDVQEWYANTSEGLEQGFTISHKPVSGKQDRLQVHLAVSGNWQGHLSQDGRWVDFRGSGLRYGKLQAWDAQGHRLGSHLRLSGQEVALEVDTRQAVYPVRIDPLIVGSGPALTDSDAAQYDYFGWGVSLSGNTALIGAPNKANNLGYHTGAAYIFVQSGGAWTQQQELTASDGASGDQFGTSVSVSGNTALIGAHNKAQFTGAAYIFVASNGVWLQQAKLTASDGASGDQFGYSVSLSGNTALVGARLHANNAGAAYVFVRSGNAWTQQAKLTASDGASGDYFGWSVSLSGNTALVGAFGNASDAGAAYVFVQSGGVWTQQQELTASDGASGDEFGWFVSVSGNTVLVGAPYHASNGAAYVFVLSNGTWTQQPELTASDGASGDDFGYSVSLSGNTVLVGAPYHAGNGAAYVFVNSSGAWSQQTELSNNDGASGDEFGYSVSVSGNTALVGAPFKATATGTVYTYQIGPELNASDSTAYEDFGWSVSVSGNTALVGSLPATTGNGAAYVFVQNGGIWIQQAKLTASDGAQFDEFGWSVSLSGNTALVGAPGNANFTGAAYVFVQSGGIWTQQRKLSASDGAQNDQFGSVVSVSGNTALIGARGHASQSGAAYVFVQRGNTWTLQAELTASDAAPSDEFGTSVSVSGNTALIGANGHANGIGAAYVFVQSGGTWTQQQELTASDTISGDGFGTSVSVSGNTALVGANGHASNVGAAYVFINNGGTWSQQAELSASDGTHNDYFGQAVSLSGDTILIGANGNAHYTGAAYVLGQSPLAQNDTYTVYVNTPLSVANAEGVLANDSDPFALSLSAVLDVPPDNGSLTLNSDGSFLYTPDTDFSGTDTFAYQATDGFDTSDLAWVTITVITPIPPVISDLDPTEGAAGVASLYLLVNGMEFTTGSVVSINSTPVSTTFVSDSQLLAVIPATYLSAPTILSVQVTNPQPNGTSNSVSLPIVNFLDSVSTGTFVIGGSPTAMTIHLNTPAPLGGLTLALSSSKPGVAQLVDSSNNPISQITFTTGQQTAQVKVETTAVSQQTTVMLQASVGGTTRSATLLVLPQQQTGVGVIHKPVVGPPLHSPGLPK